ncbi:hypothetical protein C6A85_000000106345 [Mycobacterium sp. ITM-2017-0098]|nr:hypothetical protein C6A85_000000106345 [Mycobacterium sp. ITM-2017-0098]
MRARGDRRDRRRAQHSTHTRTGRSRCGNIADGTVPTATTLATAMRIALSDFIFLELSAVPNLPRDL